MSKAADDDLTTIRCFRCFGTGEGGGGYKCSKCAGTGSVFWVNGRTFPYTPEGEKRARLSA